MADGVSTLRDQILKLMNGLSGIINTLQSVQNQFGGSGTTFGQMGDATRLISGIQTLGDTLQKTFGDLNRLEWIDPVVIALDGSPYCTGNPPVCVAARDQFRQLQMARNDGTIQKLADQLQSTGPLSNLSQTVTKLTQSMQSLTGPWAQWGGSAAWAAVAVGPPSVGCEMGSIPSPTAVDRSPTACRNW